MAKTIFASKKINILNVLNGKDALPDLYYIGHACMHNHALEGKTLRVKATKRCLQCKRESSNTFAKTREEKRDLSALHTYEEKQLNKKDDYWEDE